MRLEIRSQDLEIGQELRGHIERSRRVPEETLVMREEPSSAGPGVTTRRPSRKLGVLIVDEERPICELLRVVLSDLGFAVWTVTDGLEAFDLYSQHFAEIDLVFLDVTMPEMDGPQTLSALQRVNSRVVCCFMSGGAGKYTPKELLERGGRRLINKPFRPTEIVQVCHELVGEEACGPCPVAE